MENNLQRTDDWSAQRLGRFTASEIHKLMGIKGLGETGNTYAFEKAVEQLEGDFSEDDYVSFDMQRGIDLEPLAFNKFSELMAEEFVTAECCGFFKSKDKESGSSPDAICSNNSTLEIKCPKPNTFFKLVADGKIDPKYNFQMQKQMDDTKTEQCYFFNYMVHEGKEYWHSIVVKRDQDIIDLMNTRIAEAVVIKNEYIERINKNKQF